MLNKITHPPLRFESIEKLFRCATALRVLCMDMVEKAQSGHPGAPMGMADVATVLFTQHLATYPKDLQWAGRDRFVLSNGHSSSLIYAIQHFLGVIPMEALKHFRQWQSKTPGHPEKDLATGIETTTGPLAQGFATAVGLALGQEIMAYHFGNALYQNYTYVFVGDGCLSEGLSQEALSFAGHLGLKRLIVFFDDNRITIDGATTLSTSDDPCARFAASKWHTIAINGHDFQAIHQAILTAKQDERPTFIACRTTIGKGAPTKQGTAGCHGTPLGSEEVEKTRQHLQWALPQFHMPEEIYDMWQERLLDVAQCHQKWCKTYHALPQHTKTEHKRRFHQSISETIQELCTQAKSKLVGQSMPTRKASGAFLKHVAPSLPELIGGSADLTPSNNTKTPSMHPLKASDFSGQYIHYGVREHAMASIMNGLALYGGIRPYGGTFLVFTDYARPAIRLSALMKLPVIYIMTHDSIGLGEDGPTHQPIEHLMSLRAIPRLHVYRPADGVEVVECWQCALENTACPSLIALSRQTASPVRSIAEKNNLCAQGGYILKSVVDPQVTLLATGTEVSCALKVADTLEQKKIRTQVSSLPCWELFDKQPLSYREEVLGSATTLRVSIEAGNIFGWEKYIGPSGICIGIDCFGASAPGHLLLDAYGLNVSSIVERIEKKFNTLNANKNYKLS